jgi:hypothetical protein
MPFIGFSPPLPLVVYIIFAWMAANSHTDRASINALCGTKSRSHGRRKDGLETARQASSGSNTRGNTRGLSLDR